MKLTKVVTAAGLVLASAALLAACGGNQSSNAKTYSYVYQTDPDSLDYTLTQRRPTEDVTSNLVDGLLENDKYGNLVPSIAEDWTVSADGKTYTYKLRKDAKWYTNTGEEYADVTAQDFVTGLKHAADEKSEALYLVQNSIEGLDAYINGSEKDFSKVGVKAIDDHTVQYTLTQPESFWNSKTTMGILFPVNEEFLKSKGKDFGNVSDPSSVLSNGPFLLKEITKKSVIEFTKNTNYWDKDNVKVDGVKLAYYDGQDQDSLVRNFTDGNYTSAAVYPTSSNYASVEKEYKDNLVYSPQDAGPYFYQFNLNRQAFSHTAKKADADKEATKKAVQNKDFRQAINFAINRTSYAAQTNGEAGANKIIRNTLVPPTFVTVGDKSFGQVTEEKLAALGSEWSGVKLDDAQDGLFSADKAKAEFAKAKEALQAEGVTFPVHIDLPVTQTATNEVKKAQSLKQSVESTLGKENVVIDINQMSEDDYNNSTLMAQTAGQKDYDMSLIGWSPDYQDPSTYLDILDTKSGALIPFIGLTEKDTDLMNKVGLNEYKALLDDASKEQDPQVRYEKYASAQAWLTDSSLLVPMISGGGTASVRKTTPFTSAFSWVGTKGRGTTYKYLEVQNDTVKTSDYDAAYKKWQEEKAKSNEEAQKDLQKHVAK